MFVGTNCSKTSRTEARMLTNKFQTELQNEMKNNVIENLSRNNLVMENVQDPREIEKIIDYMYQQGIDVGVTTNGSRKLEFYKKLLPKLSSLIFSYHMEYHNREVIPEHIVALKKLALEQDRYIHVHVHMMMLPTMFDEATTALKYLKANDVPVVMRRIRPAYMKNENAQYNDNGQLIEGEISRPFYDGIVTLKMQPKGGPDYSGGLDYYSDEEKEYLKNNNV